MKTSIINPSVKIAVAIAFAAMPLLGINNAHACAACGCTLSKDWGTQGITTTPGFTADLSYDYLKQDQQRYGTGSASFAQINDRWQQGQEIEDYTTTQTTTLSLNFTGDSWGVAAQLPFVHRTHGTYGSMDTSAPSTTYPDNSSYLSSSDNGIGDIRIVGRYTGFSSDKSSGVIGGIKLPSGSTSAKFNNGVDTLDRSLQIGTGSTDLILGGFITGNIAEYGWFAQGTVQHAITTQSIDAADYKPGDAYALNTGVRYAKFGARFTPMLQLNVIHRQADSGEGATPVDALTGSPATGGTLIYLAPGALVRVNGGTSVYGFVQLPLFQKVNSLQINPRYTLTLGVKQSFQ
jgi:hypothetical protein